MGSDVVSSQRIDERRTALRVGFFCASELFVDALVAPERDHEALQDVADPAYAEGLTAFHARDRPCVAGHDRQAEVGAERFGDGADHGPSFARTVDKRHVRRAGDRAGVIVFDDKDVGTLLQHRSKLASAAFAEGGARWVLRAWGDDDRRSRGRSLERSGEEAFVVDRDGNRHERERVEKVGDPGEAGILDKDAVAGTELFAQHAFDAVQRAADDGDGFGRDSILVELFARERDQLRVVQLIAIQPRSAVQLAKKRREVRQEIRRGIAGGEIANMRRKRDGNRRRGWGGGTNAGPAAAFRNGNTPILQRAIGRGDGSRADAEVAREVTGGREAIAGGDLPRGHGSLRACGDLDGGRSREVRLYYHMSDTVLEQSASLQSQRTTVKRLAKRADYDRNTINAILDEALICHVGFVVDGAPVVIPTIHTRVGDTLYFHGSAASRMLRSLRDGVDACVTVTILDGLVMARSAFHHSMNYRSAVILGKGREVVDRDEKLRVLDALVEHVCAGRSRDVRPPNEAELRQTLVLAIPLTEASAKIRTGPPVDDDDDYALPIWAGIIPLSLTPSAPIDDERLVAGVATPDYATRYER